MKPLSNPADKKKAIILGVSVGLVFLFVVKNTMSAIAGGGTAPPESAAVPLPTGGGPAPSGGGAVVAMAPPGGAPADTKPVDDLLDPPNYTVAETPAPFHKDTVGYSGPLDFKPPDDLVIPPPIITPRPRIRRTGGMSDPGTLPTPGGKPDGPFIVQKDPEPPPQIMGVMTGDNPVAVIRVGAQQYVVTKGSKFGHNMVLKSVTESQVVIDDAGTLHILRVGARPPSPPADQSAPKPPDQGATKQLTL